MAYNNPCSKNFSNKRVNKMGNYNQYVDFVKELEQNVIRITDAKIIEDPKVDPYRYAYQHGCLLGTLPGIFVALNLTEDQVKVLENYFQK
jgi:hypothetical protein